MQSENIAHFIKQIADIIGVKPDIYAVNEALRSYNNKEVQTFSEFYQLFERKTYVSNLIISVNRVSKEEFKQILGTLSFPIIVLQKTETFEPVLLYASKETSKSKLEKKQCRIAKNELSITPHAIDSTPFADIAYLVEHNLLGDIQSFDEGRMDDVLLLSFLPKTSLFSLNELTIENPLVKPSPVQRVMHLLRNEKKDVGLIYFYAIMMGFVSLALPLGIQAIIGLVSGGLFLNSVIVLIIIVILATFVAGWIQILQLTVVEKLEQRIFAKSAFEFAYRIPRLKMEKIMNKYAPEMMNKFFDTLTIQKALPKILIDFSSAGIQIIFGLIMLALYHPLFIVFGLVVISIIVVIFYFTSFKALQFNIDSSKYKYKVAYWIEELARTIHTFKLAGEFAFPITKMDKLLNKYLEYRQKHFNVIVKQFQAIIAFKVFITAGLLILGAFLLVGRQINLGQFVAAEIIILLVISSVEKLISTLQSVYDLLTAADKVGEITDLKTERETGIDFDELIEDKKINMELSSLSYKYAASSKSVLQNISFQLPPSSSLCISGPNGSGRSTLAKILAGLFEDYQGKIIVNGMHLSEINLNTYRNRVADNLSDQDFFEGTIEENISLQKNGMSISTVLECLKAVKAIDFVNNLPHGIKTHLEAHANILPHSMKHKLMLARALARNPHVLIIDDSTMRFNYSEKKEFLEYLFSRKQDWSLIFISNNKEFMQRCDNVLLMEEGKIVAEGSYEQIKNHEVMNYL